MFYDKNQTEHLGTLTVSGTTAVTRSWPMGIHVKRILLVTTTALTTADAEIAVSVDSTEVKAFDMVQSGSAIGDVSYGNMDTGASTTDPASDGSKVVEGGTLQYVAPGEEVEIVSDGGPDAGAVELYIEYIPDGFNATLQTEMAEAA